MFGWFRKKRKPVTSFPELDWLFSMIKTDPMSWEYRDDLFHPCLTNQDMKLTIRYVSGAGYDEKIEILDDDQFATRWNIRDYDRLNDAKKIFSDFKENRAVQSKIRRLMDEEDKYKKQEKQECQKKQS